MEMLAWVKSRNVFFKVQEGTGDNLLREDVGDGIKYGLSGSAAATLRIRRNVVYYLHDFKWCENGIGLVGGTAGGQLVEART